MIRTEPLHAPDTALLDRHGAMWDEIIDKLMFRSLPTVLSNPCPECGDYEIVCRCMVESDDTSSGRVA